MKASSFVRLKSMIRNSARAMILAFLVLGTVAVIGLRSCAWATASRHTIPVARRSMNAFPRVMLWAWERPEDMRFLNTHEAGVAFLAGTIEIRSTASPGHGEGKPSVALEPRMQPLRVPPGTALMAVVRIETSNDLWHHPPGWRGSGSGSSATSLYSVEQRRRVVGMILSLAQLRGVHAIQLDYDATTSEQPFYRRVLMAVRRRLPPGMPLSMTALASWCVGDPWLDSLPAGTIDEAVPMLFRMGPDGSAVETFVESGHKFRVPACRDSLGVSTDEAFSRQLLSGGVPRMGRRKNPRRVYVFSDRAWTKANVKQILSEVGRWDAASRQSR